MRTSEDLIKELKEKSALYTFLTLVVGFRDHSEFVFDFDEEPLEN